MTSAGQFSVENEFSLTVARSDQAFDAVIQRMIQPQYQNDGLTLRRKAPADP